VHVVILDIKEHFYLSYKMDDIPPPVNLHFGRDGFKHESSADIYDWVSAVDNSREYRTAALRDMDYTIDTVTGKTKGWLRDRRELTKAIPRESNTNYVMDYSEVGVMRARFR
jgi:hypothetical protein